MSRKNPVRAAKRTNSRLQAFLLLILGVFCVLAAWLLHPNPYAYPVGILLLGLGMLLAAALNPYRLVIGGILTTLIGMAVFLSFKPVIPVLRGQDLVTFLLAIGLALLGIALMTRRGRPASPWIDLCSGKHESLKTPPIHLKRNGSSSPT